MALKMTRAGAVAGRRTSVQVCAAKTVGGKTAGKTVGGKKTASSKPAAAPAQDAPAGTWFPGAEIPEWLSADLPGNRGFDPFGLGKDAENLARFQEAEIFHARVALLGALGVVAVEGLGYGNWYDATSWAWTGGKPTYFGVENPLNPDVPTLLAISTGAFAFVEYQRGAETDPELRKYPGGNFDPLNLMADPDTAAELKVKELKNGRLAMVSCLGFYAQHAATGKGPLAALNEHLSNPTANNFTTNGVSIPQ